MRLTNFIKGQATVIKRNWFTLAIFALLLGAIIKQKTTQPQNQHNPVITNPVHSEEPKVEKFTEGKPAKKSGSVLGIFSNKKNGLEMPTVSKDDAAAFFKRFNHVAQSEQKKYGVPASVILATAFVNSFGGTRDAARVANNYFALDCEDVLGKKHEENGKCKTKFETAWESFRAFSLFLEAQPWFSEAKQTVGSDIGKWLNILSKNQMSDVADYEKLAKQVIEQYELAALDKP